MGRVERVANFMCFWISRSGFFFYTIVTVKNTLLVIHNYTLLRS